MATPPKAQVKKARKTAKKTAAKAVVEKADRQDAGRSGGSDYLDPQKRMARVDARSMVVAALNRCRPGTKSGVANKCWSGLSHDERVAIAEAHCVRHQSEPKVRAEFGDVLKRAAVHKSTLDRFLRDVREAYMRVYEERLSELTEADQAAFSTTDLNALQGLVYARLAPKFVAAGLHLRPDSTAKEMHPILRFMEGLSDAVKVQADAQHTELKSLILAVRAEAANGAKARSQADRAVSQTVIVDLIDGFLRGRAPKPTPAGGDA